MKFPVAALMLVLVVFPASIGTSCASRHVPQPVSKQVAEDAVETPADTNEQLPATPPTGGQTIATTAAHVPNFRGEQPVNSADQPTERSIWRQENLSPLVSLLAAACSVWFFFKSRTQSREIAERTVTFEAQKLLLEINKQFIADPSLFAIYDDNLANEQALKKHPKLKAKVEALGYMKLNVFEIVFAKLPVDSTAGPWKAYFLDSLDRCSVLRDELKASRAIYHPRLLREYKEWDEHKEEKARRAVVRREENSESKAAWLDNTTYVNEPPPEAAKAVPAKPL